MPLPLPIRKAIRDSEPAMKESLEKLQQVTGKEFTVEIDWEKNLGAVDEGNKANLPSTYQADVIKYLVENIEAMCAEETTKEAFLEASSSNKIVINVAGPKAAKYWDIKFVNGDIVLEHKKELYNVSEVRWFDIKTVIPSPGGLSLVQRLSLEKSREQMEEHLEKLNTATGANDWSIEADWERIIKDLEKGSADTVGDIFQNTALGYITENIVEAVKAETIKEAFNEATSNHKIVFRLNNDKKFTKYWDVTIANGDVIVDFKKELYNQSELRWLKLDEKIPSPGGLSLVQRLSLEKYTEKRDELLQTLNEATGASDWSLEVDFEKAVKELEKSNADRVGEVYYQDCLNYIVENIVEFCKNETSKEAFLEATTEKKIIFRVNNDKKFTKYWDIKFENGTIVIDHKKELYNQSEIRWFNLASVMPVPGVISLLGKLSLEKNREEFNEQLEKMKEVTGEEYTFDESCLDDFYKSVDESNKNQIGDITKQILTYWVANVETRLKDEMVKEAFLEVTNARQITLTCNNKQSPYWDIKFDNGVIVISYKKDLYNQSEVQWFDFEKLL